MFNKALSIITLLGLLITSLSASASVLLGAPGPSYFWYFSGQYPTYQGICIGGEICGVDNEIEVLYPAGSWVNAIEVGCHDNVGDKTKAHLQVYVNGVKIGEQDVKRDGSTLTFPISKYVFTLELKSVNENHASYGDETVVYQLNSY